MAGRIDYAVSVSAIQTNNAFEGVTQEAIESDIGRSLGGGKSNTTWAGAGQSPWSGGTCTCVTSDGGSTGALSAVDGLWIKHTGFNFDNSATGKIGSTVNTAKLIISTGSTEICRLSPGGAIFFEDPANATINFTDDGTPCAVEFAILT
jgi:hypothetical protein